MQKKNIGAGLLLVTSMLGAGGYFGFQPTMRWVYPEPKTPAAALPVESAPPIHAGKDGAGDVAYTKQDFLAEVQRQVKGIADDLETRKDDVMAIALRGGAMYMRKRDDRLQMVVTKQGENYNIDTPESFMVLLDLTKIREHICSEWKKLPEEERPTRPEVYAAAETVVNERMEEVYGKVQEELNANIATRALTYVLPDMESAKSKAHSHARSCISGMLGKQLSEQDRAVSDRTVAQGGTPVSGPKMSLAEAFGKLTGGGWRDKESAPPEEKDQGPSR